MADESLENRDPASERSGQAPSDGENRERDPSSNRRRIIITSLLTPPAVMTLSARRAHAASGSTVGSSDPSAKKLKHPH
jgi:hypothetical protein